MPAPENTHDHGRSHLTIDLPAGPASDRPIVWAVALSASLHLLLLSAVGLASFHTYAPRPRPEMRLLLEAADSGTAEHETEGPLESPAQPVNAPSEDVLTSVAGQRSSVAQAHPEKTSPVAAPAETTATSESTAPAGDSATATVSTLSVHADSPAEAGPVLTTEGVSEREMPAHTEASTPQQPGIAISSAQETMLSRWIVQAARGLEEANLAQARLSLQHMGHRYTARLERHAATDEMGIDHVNVEITTEEDGKLLHTLVQLKRLAFSHFTQFVNDWDPEDELHADAIQGRFHSNSAILIDHDRITRVAGRLTTAAAWVDVRNASIRVLREIFRGGIETGTPRIAMPASFSVGSVGDRGKVRSFARRARITFYPDGTYGWQEAGSNAPEQRQEVSAPHYIVASRGATLSVRGTVRGTIVVYAPERIVVEGSLRYAHDPVSQPDAGDYLALISNKDIEIAPPSLTGPGDLEIQAAIFAKRRFVVSDYESPRGQKGCPCKATLVIHGSLAAGSLSPTEPRYATRYAFDPRFEQVRPPGFPVTNRYEVESWDGHWQEAEASGAAARPEPAPEEPPAG